MAADDFVEPEVAVAMAAVAALFSPPVRALARRGAIGALAGVLTAADLARSALRVIAPEGGVPLPIPRTAPGLEDIRESPTDADTPANEPRS